MCLTQLYCMNNFFLLYYNICYIFKVLKKYSVRIQTYFLYFKYVCILALAECYRVNLTGPKYVKRNEAIQVVCSSNQTPIGLTTDFLVNGITYTSLRSTTSGCYSAHLRTRCPSNSIVCYCNKEGKEYGLVINASPRNHTMTILCLMKFQNDGQVYKSDSIIVDIYGKH